MDINNLKTTLEEKGHLIKEKGQTVFTKKRLKKALGFLVICAIAVGGAKWYDHQQKIESRAQRIAAQTKLIEARAAEQNINIISSDSARTVASKAVGINESDLSFKEIRLMDRFSPDMEGKGKHGNQGRHNRDDNDDDDDRKNRTHRRENYIGHQEINAFQAPNQKVMPILDNQNQGVQNVQPQAEPSAVPPQSPQIPEAGATSTPAPTVASAGASGNLPSFMPFYMVRMAKDKIDYLVTIDAVSGKVLTADIIGTRKWI